MTSAVTRRRWLRVGLVVVAVVVLLLYLRYDPATSILAPKCPFKLLTGYDCPGCGSQRAIHGLLTGDFAAAWRANPLFVAALPYLLGGFVLERLRLRSVAAERWWSRLYGTGAAIVLLVVIFAFWILRNILT